jgi:hypothetical protein
MSFSYIASNWLWSCHALSIGCLLVFIRYRWACVHSCNHGCNYSLYVAWSKGSINCSRIRVIQQSFSYFGQELNFAFSRGHRQLFRNSITEHIILFYCCCCSQIFRYFFTIVQLEVPNIVVLPVCNLLRDMFMFAEYDHCFAQWQPCVSFVRC